VRPVECGVVRRRWRMPAPLIRAAPLGNGNDLGTAPPALRSIYAVEITDAGLHRHCAEDVGGIERSAGDTARSLAAIGQPRLPLSRATRAALEAQSGRLRCSLQSAPNAVRTTRKLTGALPAQRYKIADLKLSGRAVRRGSTWCVR
jgi:hypothetical protein